MCCACSRRRIFSLIISILVYILIVSFYVLLPTATAGHLHFQKEGMLEILQANHLISLYSCPVPSSSNINSFTFSITVSGMPQRSGIMPRALRLTVMAAMRAAPTLRHTCQRPHSRDYHPRSVKGGDDYPLPSSAPFMTIWFPFDSPKISTKAA
jgi:type IV secretory pathway VirB6-like protein